jgi:hypothetical protein
MPIQSARLIIVLSSEVAECSVQYVHVRYQANEPMRRRCCTRGRQRRARAVGDEN